MADWADVALGLGGALIGAGAGLGGALLTNRHARAERLAQREREIRDETLEIMGEVRRLIEDAQPDRLRASFLDSRSGKKPRELFEADVEELNSRLNGVAPALARLAELQPDPGVRTQLRRVGPFVRTVLLNTLWTATTEDEHYAEVRDATEAERARALGGVDDLLATLRGEAALSTLSPFAH